jgi:hypothetical protein
MNYSPFNLSEEDRVFYLRIVLFLLSLCIGELILLHTPRPPPPGVIADQIVQVILAVCFLFWVVSFFCNGAVVLLTIFD